MRVEKALRRWGNGFGIAVSKSEARALGLLEGDPLDVDLQPRRTTRVEDLPSMHAGGRTDMDRILDEDLADELAHKAPRATGGGRAGR